MRKSMKKLIALTLTCLMLATLFVGCGSKDEGGDSDGDVIKLGWMGSLTGEQAAFGTCESQTVQMLVDDLNANGGLLGKQVKLFCYDTKGDAQEAVNVAKRLCAQDKVCAIIGPNASGQCIAIQSVLDQYKISDMSTVATNEKVTVQDVNGTPCSRTITSVSASSTPFRDVSLLPSSPTISAMIRLPSFTMSTTTMPRA